MNDGFFDPAAEDFAAAVRFVVCSDIHLDTGNPIGEQRLRQMMRTAYAEASQDPGHPQVDAFLFAGDLTNHGTRAQYEAFWRIVQEEKHADTQVYSVLAKNHDNWECGRQCKKTGLRHYRALSGQATDFYVQIGGISVIGISTCKWRGRYYTRQQRTFLKQALKDAAVNSKRPILVLQHEHVKNTVFGSSDFDGWGNDYFKKILSSYPQVLHFSGHSHYPLNDPRSIFQQDYTAIGTGAMRYAELTVDNERKVHPPQHEEINQGWLVEVDHQDRVRLRGFDFLSDTELCRYLIEAPADKTRFQFRPEQQRSRSKAPRFPEDAALQITADGDALRVQFPAAISTDGFPVFLYRVQLLNAQGNVLCEETLVPPYWKRSDDAAFCVTLQSEKAAVCASVQAENAYKMASTPISKEVSSDV